MRLAPIVQSLTEPLLSPLVSAITGASSSGFSPTSLFVSGQQGYVYDLNDQFAEKTAYRRNLLTYSEQLGAAPWSGATYTVTADQIAAPDGTTTADLVTATSAGGQVRQFFVSTAGIRTFSCYVKKGNVSVITFKIINIADAFTFNLDTGLVTGGIHAGTSFVENVGNGWYRIGCWLDTVAQTNYGPGLGLTSTSDTVYAWGFQMEVGSAVSAYQRVTDWNTELLAAFPQTALYLDSAGTTAASVNGLVGLVLDKSKGLALGAELLSSGAIGVTGTATAATYNTSTGAGTVTRVDSSNQSFVTFTGLTSTAFYQVTIQNTGSNILSFRQGTFASTILGDIGVGQTKTFISLATTSQLTVTMSPVAGSGSFVISTFKALAGNHAYQATTGNKPVLRGTPVGGNLVTNGDFATDTVWNKGAGWSIGSGVATKAAGTTNSLLQAISLTAGKVYRLTYTITATAGGVQPLFSGGTSAFGVLRSASGTYVEWLTANTGNVDFGFTVNALFAGTVDNVEVVDVSAGSVQAPYALQFDGVDDFLQTASVDFATVTSDGLARRNLLTFPTAFDNAAWPKTSISVSANVTGAPDGTLNADKLVEAVSGATTHSIGQGFSFVNGVTYTFSAYIKKAERDWAILQFNSSPFVDGNARTLYVDSNTGTLGTIPAGATATVQDAGNGWWRFSLTTTATQSATGAVSIYTASGNNGAAYVGDGTSGLFVWGAQLETGSTASTFQNIGTDKMTVCHGLRKLSDAASGVFVELTTSADANLSSFYIAAPYGAGATFAFQSRGTGSTAPASASGSPSPALAVITGIGEIATDTSVLRRNGTQVASSAVDQGTGNYANAAMYFGRRGGASIPFNGLMFSAICVGKAVSATELAGIERWTNQRTGAY